MRPPRRPMLTIFVRVQEPCTQTRTKIAAPTLNHQPFLLQATSQPTVHKTTSFTNLTHFSHPNARRDREPDPSRLTPTTPTIQHCQLKASILNVRSHYRGIYRRLHSAARYPAAEGCRYSAASHWKHLDRQTNPNYKILLPTLQNCSLNRSQFSPPQHAIPTSHTQLRNNHPMAPNFQPPPHSTADLAKLKIDAIKWRNEPTQE